jgi:hypothetical protein
MLLRVEWLPASSPWLTYTFANATWDNDVPGDLPPYLAARDESRPRLVEKFVGFGRRRAVASCGPPIERL